MDQRTHSDTTGFIIREDFKIKRQITDNKKKEKKKAITEDKPGKS